MTFIPIAPVIPFSGRSANTDNQRRLTDSILPLESLPTRCFTSIRAAEATSAPAFWAWSTAFPLLLWAGQEEASTASPDSGGTIVFLCCCALALIIFSKTGWRNELPQ